MTALELIQTGFETKNWQLVSDAYKMLTGNSLHEKAPAPTEHQPFVSVKHAALVKAKTSASGIASRADGFVNLFVDDGSVPTDTEFNKQVLPATPSPRRAPVKYVIVRCDQCHTEEEVHPTLAPKSIANDGELPRYVCNKCMSSKRRAS